MEIKKDVSGKFYSMTYEDYVIFRTSRVLMKNSDGLTMQLSINGEPFNSDQIAENLQKQITDNQTKLAELPSKAEVDNGVPQAAAAEEALEE